ncbi:MAG: long-chain fatty acid--CoA ligase [Ferruginibacter sp.]|nr:long-chain fatty acid--CoA ligase [Cytophagales bacterium]
METPIVTQKPTKKVTQELTRVFDLMLWHVEKFNKEDALANKVNGQWVKYSSQDVLNQANKVSLGLIKLGIGKGDKIAVISPNRPEWNFVDFGIQQLGAVSVPMYPNITEEDYRYIFSDAEVKLVFVADENLYNRVRSATKNLTGIQEVYTFDRVTGAKQWTEVWDLEKDGSQALLESHKAGVSPEDLLTLIYTSGTTGNPKGVMLTHGNLMSNVEASVPNVPVDHTGRALSFLPMCHIYERMCIYLYLRSGISVYYAESLETIGDNLKEVKPNVFTTVPRLLEKVYDKIVNKGYELTGVKKRLFFWALDLGLKYDPNQDQGPWYNAQLKLANRLIFNKWREALGGNITLISSGAAALQSRLTRVFWAAGIPVAEGYGLTETSPVVSTSRIEPGNMRIGCVGKVISGVQVKIADDGEILVKGPNVMKGYYKKPQLTAEVMDEEGWFHTGDIGEMVEGQFLKITDRKKEMFKTSGGKYIAPQLIENKLKESILIEQAMVVGDGQRFPSVLLVPSFPALREWAKTQGLTYTSDADMVTKSDVVDEFQKELNSLNEHFAQYERVKRFALLPNLWGVEGGELTPTLKLKRKIIYAKYKDQIDQMYT